MFSIKLNKQFWVILLSFAPTFVVVLLAINYFFPGENGFQLYNELGSASFVGIFTSIMLYFNRYNLKGERRPSYQKSVQKESK